jgi:hypothetical protein
MGRIQQRMDNLQRMLEACMEMQLELQRSIRQEVSAAMHRSTDQPGFLLVSSHIMTLHMMIHKSQQYTTKNATIFFFLWTHLNRFTGPSKDTASYESKWEYVRKGICCVCCESNIDSLLYRYV